MGNDIPLTRFEFRQTPLEKSVRDLPCLGAVRLIANLLQAAGDRSVAPSPSPFTEEDVLAGIDDDLLRTPVPEASTSPELLRLARGPVRAEQARRSGRAFSFWTSLPTF